MSNLQNTPGDSMSELANTSLEKIKKKNIFITPENYFEMLPTEISARISTKENSGYLSHYFSLKIVITTMFIAAIFIAGGIYMSTQTTSPEKNYQALLFEDIISPSIIDQFDEDVLFEYYVLDESIIITSDLSNDEFDQYKNYLLENNTDVTLIFNEL